MDQSSIFQYHRDERTFGVFSYGLCMDADALCAEGVVPSDRPLVSVDGHAVRLRAQTMLLRSPARRACGVLGRPNRHEMELGAPRRPSPAGDALGNRHQR